MIRRLKVLLVCIVLILVVGSAVLVVAALDDKPLLVDVPELTSADMNRAKALLELNDPRSLADGEVGTLELSERDVNLMLSYALRELDAGVARVELGEGAAAVELSLLVPDNPIGQYVNISMVAAATGSRELAISSLQVGSVRVPDWLATWVARRGHALLSRDDTYRDVVASLDSIEIDPAATRIRYHWQRSLAAEVVERGRNALKGSNVDTDTIAIYYEEARQRAAAFAGLDKVSISRLMQPLYALARERTAQGRDPIEENRAALLAVSIYALGVNPDMMLDVDTGQAANRRSVPIFTLRGRKDFAQHFLVSAAVSAAAGSALADTLGLQKELDDSRGGSGFSFTDLAADRAGVRFVGRALGSTDTARGAQDVLAESASESDFMPNVRDLPEFMSAAEFERRFEGVGSPAYNSMLREIERRIDAVPLYQ